MRKNANTKANSKSNPKKGRGVKVWAIVTSILLVIAIAANVVLLTVPIAGNSFNLLFGGERAILAEGEGGGTVYEQEFSTKDEALRAAQDFVIEVEKEGITLLKNESQALPLESGARVSVFGKNSVNIVTSGSGSASSNSSAAGNTLYDSLTAAGISYNQTLKSFYEDNGKSGSGRPENPAMTSGQRLAGYATGETPIASYTADVTASYRDFSDAAIVVISRIGGEGFDLPRTMATDFTYQTAVTGAESADSHYLELDANEKALIAHVKENFSRVIVLLNVGTTMEMGEVQSDGDVDAVVWMGFPGGTGIMALGQVLTGKMSDGTAFSPSGHTVDTWASDFTQDPTWFNTGVYGSEFGNRYLYGGDKTDFAFVNYMEGIYVGYRYYETRGFEETRNDAASTWYQDHVVYPFGYGLSYTTFDWDVTFKTPDGTAISENDLIDVSVKVKNTGNYAGKEVVQLYYSAPYSYDQPSIEKSHVVLGDFVKTKLLQPGEEETVTLQLKVSDMKSYDYADQNENGFSGYELEAGDYQVFVSANAHDHRAAATYPLAGGVQLATEADRWGTDVQVSNRFDDVSAGIYGDWTAASFVSRRDFAGTVPTDYLPDSARTLTDAQMDALKASIKRKYSASDEGQPWEVTGVTFGDPVNNNLSLKSLLDDNGSVSFDDPRWESLLDEITLDEMKTLVGYGAFRTNPVSGVDGIVNKPMTTDADGPSGFTSFLSESVIYNTCAYQAECVLGSTWNTDLAERMGELVGEEGLIGNEKGDGLPYTGWYAPAVNIHRSPFAGRNWEYYSEDGVLSGKFAARVVEGAASRGVYCYMKHFAVNDQETDREYNGILVWLNEQAMREIYLKPFEIAVRTADVMVNGMMSSFNRLGMTWAGGSYPLLTSVLRNEWGARGPVITDFSLNTYTHVDEMIRAGGDLFLTQDAKTFNKDDDATQISLLRQASKNILYAVVNSNAMGATIIGYKPPIWHTWMYCIDGALAVLLALWGILAFRKAKKKAK
ncbi:MAG: glycoside hydrolase family 3 C-terminal domain-containing protein [Clostridia bacterium]|nr:glycoside hydrolase family 3 C-terminal domain-containing protein [Clostridia bacterium]